MGGDSGWQRSVRGGSSTDCVSFVASNHFRLNSALFKQRFLRSGPIRGILKVVNPIFSRDIPILEVNKAPISQLCNQNTNLSSLLKLVFKIFLTLSQRIDQQVFVVCVFCAFGIDQCSTACFWVLHTQWSTNGQPT